MRARVATSKTVGATDAATDYRFQTIIAAGTSATHKPTATFHSLDRYRRRNQFASFTVLCGHCSASVITTLRRFYYYETESLGKIADYIKSIYTN